MKTAALIFLVTMTLASAGAETPAPAQEGYSRYKLVRTRNIFDPERRAFRQDAAPVRTQTAAPGARANYLSLTGTMVTPSKTLAFFSGSQSDYNKVINLREKIADFTVTNITGSQVELSSGGKTTVLAVGRQLSFQGGTYTVQAAPPPADAAPSPADAAPAPDAAPKPAGPPAAAPAAPAGAPNDVLRKMMERRQKELSR